MEPDTARGGQDVSFTQVVEALTNAIRNSGDTCSDWTEAFVRAWRGFGHSAAPFRDDEGMEAWALASYSYAAQFPREGEVRGTLFLNADRSYTHLLFSTMSGQFVQKSGLELDDVYPRVSVAIFANELAAFQHDHFRVLQGERAESLAVVLARSLAIYGNGGMPPIFTQEYRVE